MTTENLRTPDADKTACASEGAKDRDWADQVKKFALAAIGAVHLSQDDVKGFVKRLVEKGEIAKKDGEKIVKQFAERVQQTVKRDTRSVAEKVDAAVGAVAERAGAVTEKVSEVASKAAEAAKDVARDPGAVAGSDKLAEKINVSIERLLKRMNIASRKDLEGVSKQLDELDRKVTELVEATTHKSCD